jgi:KDO2-lipid IV(A) lauroyltransferase
MARAKKKLPTWTHGPLSFAIRGALSAVLSARPVTTIRGARALGRWFGSRGFNRKRLGRAEENLRVAFPDWGEDRVREYALRAYEHLLALAVEISYGPRLLTEEGWLRRVEFGSIPAAVRVLVEGRPTVLITGHCGNWEVLGYTVALMGFPIHGLYRPLDFAPLDRWVRETRGRRGMTLVDKFGAVQRLPTLIREGAPPAFVADQNGGDRGVFVPFFNRLTSTYKSIGLLAMQFNADVICGFTVRQDPLPGEAIRYRLEVTDVFGPKDWNTHPDPLFYLTARYRRGIETMIRRVPDQYDWIHRVWRSRPRHERLGRPFPEALREKLRLLPWITEADMAMLEEHSIRDAKTLAETGQSRLS